MSHLRGSVKSRPYGWEPSTGLLFTLRNNTKIHRETILYRECQNRLIIKPNYTTIKIWKNVADTIKYKVEMLADAFSTN